MCTWHDEFRGSGDNEDDHNFCLYVWGLPYLNIYKPAHARESSNLPGTIRSWSIMGQGKISFSEGVESIKSTWALWQYSWQENIKSTWTLLQCHVIILQTPGDNGKWWSKKKFSDQNLILSLDFLPIMLNTCSSWCPLPHKSCWKSIPTKLKATGSVEAVKDPYFQWGLQLCGVWLEHFMMLGFLSLSADVTGCIWWYLRLLPVTLNADFDGWFDII